MEDSMVLWASPEHLNSMLCLATFISNHNPSISVIMLTTASASPTVTYHRLGSPAAPQNSTFDPFELLYETPRLTNPNLRQALEEIQQKSNIKAFVIDFFCNSASEVSTSMNIPTYFYYSSGASCLCVLLHLPTIYETIAGDIGDLNDFIQVPGCPPLHSSDLPQSSFYRENKICKYFIDTAINMKKSAGILVNTFYPLEFRAMEALTNDLCVLNAPSPPVYSLGPLIAEANNKHAHECLRWLDSQPSKSVIFLCFGRTGVFPAEQLEAIALGLERSGCRFLWAVRSPPGKPDLAASEEPDLAELLPEGFLERTKDRGLVLKSWAPQMEVLRHGSVGGFVTHCGQSSVLEAVSSGVPMIGWPLYAEQRMNRVFMVNEMKVALPLEEADGGFVTAAEFEKRVKELMAGNEVRRRVMEMKSAAEAAVTKGGSSLVALDKFMEAIGARNGI
ncbi:UNVERIFIED_CONTAM: Chalcone 4'-O-glucosyltransferase [Sesamum radiatum]|uniref:Glycosyltransferase n=1 Tax=Sesamum radiatum TaxID=300843 RepID=A0AAW2TEH9_SESRA